MSVLGGCVLMKRLYPDRYFIIMILLHAYILYCILMMMNVYRGWGECWGNYDPTFRAMALQYSNSNSSYGIPRDNIQGWSVSQVKIVSMGTE